MNIAIIGLGLIGGSYAKATKSRTLHTVYGFDLDSEVMMFARMTGAIDKPLTDELLTECDLVLTALRPAAAIRWAEEHKVRPGMEYRLNMSAWPETARDSVLQT